VQGVFFRKNAETVARGLGLTGYAQNMQDGSVEIVCEGKESALKKMLEWCYRGSILAHVDGLSFAWEEPQNEFNNFSIRYASSFLRDKIAAVKQLSKHLVEHDAIAPEKLPRHVVIIPDGNRRWAREHGVPIWRGHQKGMDRAVDLLREMRRLNIKYVTLWGFSTENWSRKKDEVEKLMDIFLIIIKKFRAEALRDHIRFHHFGRTDRLPEVLLAAITSLEKETAIFTEFHFGLALDYGGRDEILRAFEKIQQEGEPVSEEAISHALDTQGFPDTELIIRTSGEQRLSGIMPWQGVYAELYFAPVHFPDFDEHQLHFALADFARRERRFGGGH